MSLGFLGLDGLGTKKMSLADFLICCGKSRWKKHAAALSTEASCSVSAAARGGTQRGTSCLIQFFSRKADELSRCEVLEEENCAWADDWGRCWQLNWWTISPRSKLYFLHGTIPHTGYEPASVASTHRLPTCLWMDPLEIVVVRLMVAQLHWSSIRRKALVLSLILTLS